MRLSVILCVAGLALAGAGVVLGLRGGAPPAALAAAPALAPAWGPSPFGPVGAAPRQWNGADAGPAPASAVYGRNGRQVDLGGLSVAHYIASRIGAARMGDVKAAYAVYQAMSICANNDEAVADDQEAQQRAALVRERAGLKALCADISPAQVQERMRFLTAAAKAGNAAARIDYYMEGPYGRPVDLAQNQADPVVQQWKTDAVDFLKGAANQCDHFALALLSTLYDAGDVTGRDLRQSMAYSIADAAARKVPMSEQHLRERFGEQLSEADFAAARRDGALLAGAACAK